MSKTLKVFAVVRQDGSISSAWTDEYDAKFEAARWSQDFKEDWTYVPATLVLEEGDSAATVPVAAEVATV